MQTDNFLGYTSKKDGQVDNLGMASDCNNVVINKGDLCNFPYPQVEYFTTDPREQKLYALYYYKGHTHLIGFYVPLSQQGTFTTRFAVINNFADKYITDPDQRQRYTLNLPDGSFSGVATNAARIQAIHGNMIQVGEWLYVLNRLGVINPDFSLPTMLRLKINKVDDANATLPFESRIVPVGIKAPFHTTTTSGLPLAAELDTYDDWGSNQYTLGFTFVTNIFDGTSSGHDNPEADPLPSDGSDWINITDTNDIESNGILYETPASYSGTKPQFRIYFYPRDRTTVLKLKPLIGCYARNNTSSQTEYYFIGYQKVNYTTIGTEDVVIDRKTHTLNYVDFIINCPDPSNIQDYDKTIPATGVTGPIINSHNVPRAAVHATFYKRKMYYQSLPSEEWYEGFSENSKNRLEVSMATPDGEDETGRYVNYIEAEEFIGLPHERGCGLIEYLDQLIMFKETETHVLTGDILDPSTQRRILFSKIGGINTHGGKAYIVIDEILYWASIDYKIWRYDGGSAPTVISTIIEEDLRAIPIEKYRMMRLGYDPINKLMFVTFPIGAADTRILAYANNIPEELAAKYPAFIYHYDENGKWTKSKDLYFNQVINDEEKVTFLAYTDKLEELKSIDDATTVPIYNRRMQWESTKITNGNIGKNKHYKGIKVLTVEDYPVKPFVHIGDFLTSKPKELQYNEYTTLGRHGKKHTVSLAFSDHNDRVKGQPFRINGLELDVHTVGRK